MSPFKPQVSIEEPALSVQASASTVDISKGSTMVTNDDARGGIADDGLGFAGRTKYSETEAKEYTNFVVEKERPPSWSLLVLSKLDISC